MRSEQSLDLGSDDANHGLNDRENLREVNPNFAHAIRQNESIRVQEAALNDRRERLQAPTGDQAAVGRSLGNGAPFPDPNNPGYSAWYLMVNGHIQSGTFEDSDGICCHFDILSTQNEWQVVAVSSPQIRLICFFRASRRAFRSMRIRANRLTDG